MLLFCFLLQVFIVNVSADRLTYLNLAVDTLLMSIPLPPSLDLPGGQYGPRVSFETVAIERQPTFKRTGDISANSVGNSEILELRIGLEPLTFNFWRLYIDGINTTATLTISKNSIHLAAYIPDTPGCGIQVTTLTVERFDGIEFNCSNASYDGKNSLVQQYIDEYVLPQVNGFLTIVKQTIQEYVYYYCRNFHRYMGGTNPYLQHLNLDGNKNAMLEVLRLQ